METSSSLAVALHGVPVVYANERVSGVVPEAGVKLAVARPGFTTRFAGGFETESAAEIEMLPTFGLVMQFLVIG